MSKNWRLDMPNPEAYWIDRVLYDVQHDEQARLKFKADPAAYLKEIPLSDQLKAELGASAFGPLYLAGANPYLLRAHCLAMDVDESDYLAQMRAVAEVS